MIKFYTKIHDNIYIRKNVRIYELCNIGGTGFGYIWVKINILIINILEKFI